MRYITDPKALKITPSGKNKWKVRLRGQCTRRNKIIDIRRTITGTRAEAEQAAIELLQTDEVDHERMTVKAFARSWLISNAPRWRPKTAERNGARMDVWMKKTDIADFYLDALRPLDVQQCVNQLEANGLVSREYIRLIRNMFNSAVENQLMDRNPAQRVQGKEHSIKRKEALTPSELSALLDNLNGHWRAMASLMAFTGLRFCHVAPLRWKDLNLEEGFVSPKLSLSARQVVPISMRKNAPKRIPIGAVVPALRACKAQAAALPNALVFPSDTGDYHWARALQRALQVAAKKAGIPKKISGHCLRVTFNSLALQCGNETVVRALMGHSTSEMTALYARIEDDQHTQLQAKVFDLVANSGQFLGNSGQ